MRRFLLILACLMALSAQAQRWPASSIQTHAGSRWWWLGSAVEEEELSELMKEYSSHGIRTLEITPIYGVKGNEAKNVDFLSPRWMEILKHVEELGIRNRMQIDMNTGTGWPFGGPQVPQSEAACRVMYRVDTIQVEHVSKLMQLMNRIPETKLNLAPTESLKAASSTDADEGAAWKTARVHKVMAYRLDMEATPVDLTNMVTDNVLSWKSKDSESRWQIFTVYMARTQQLVKRAAPGGEGWAIDHFDAQAVKHYLERFEKAFADNGVPYPDTFFNDSYEVYGADWTPGIFDDFYKRRGYKLEEHLPELLLNIGENPTQVLIDYRETLSDMLLDNFTRQWTAWAHSHNVKTRNQAHGSPANLIDHYAAVDIPEVEGFGLSDFGIKGLRTDADKVRPNYSDLSMLKYASSAAHITGKPLTSCESFTWLTEHFRTSLSQLKPDVDLIFCAGVNRVYFHGTAYSPENEPWPGWKFYASIDMSPTNSIWRDAANFTDYVNNCQRFLQWGEPDNDFLVYLPVRDMWAKRTSDLLMMFEISNMDQNAPEFIRDVLLIDSLGFDCDYISDSYLLGTTYQDGKLKTAAGVSYKALIIPGEVRMTTTLKTHLDRLKAQGAPILYRIDKAEMSRLAKPEELKTVCGLHMIRRSNPTGYHYFISNLTPNDVDQYVNLGVNFQDAMLFNPLNDSERYSVEKRDGKVRIRLRSGESIIMQTFNTPVPDAGRQPELDYSVTKDLTASAWTLSFEESAPAVKQTFKLPKVQTWETLNDDSVKVTMGTGVYACRFTLTRREMTNQWAIDLGDVRESARVFVNGRYIGTVWSVPYVLKLRNLKVGNNDLRIEVTNLPANRIRDLDKRGVPWRKFEDLNVVDIHYQHTTYENWEPMPSGLNSTVKLIKCN
jgi:hypothetical protein